MFLVTMAVLGLLVSRPLGAVSVENMFSAEVRVEDASEEARETGIKAALGQVLVRVTGSRAVALQPELADLVEGAAAFVQAFRYRREGSELFLAVAFDRAALQDRVARAGVPVWGSERPAVLVWLAIDYGGGRRSVVPADSDGAAARVIRVAAQERGLPVSLPLMDAQDREKVGFADIWGGFNEALEAASLRYAPDALLIGRARRLASGRLSVDWRLQFGSTVLNERAGLADGIEFAADYLASQFAVGGDASAAQDVHLEVSGVQNLASYARVLGHLENLSVTDAVRLTGMTGDSAFFELRLRGSREQLQRALALGGVLQALPLNPIGEAPGQQAALRYRPAP